MRNNRSSREKHSFIQFYFDDWKAGTAHLPRLVRSVYFDICLYNWDKRKAASPSALKIMLYDVDKWSGIVEALVDEGALVVDSHGSVHSPRAMREAERAFAAWEGKSQGGKTARGTADKDSSKNGATMMKQSSQDSSTEPDSDSDTEPDSEESPSEPPPRLGPADVAEAWNDMARSAHLAQIKVMTEERQKRLKARIEEHGAEAIIAGIKLIPESPFLMGQGDRRWKAHFDWLLQPASCTKLLEGGYAEGRGRPSGWVGD